MKVLESTLKDYLLTVYEDFRWKVEFEGELVSYGLAASLPAAKRDAVEETLVKMGRASAATVNHNLTWINREE